MWFEEKYRGFDIYGVYEDKPFPFEGNIIYISDASRFSRGDLEDTKKDIDNYLKRVDN